MGDTVSDPEGPEEHQTLPSERSTARRRRRPSRKRRPPSEERPSSEEQPASEEPLSSEEPDVLDIREEWGGDEPEVDEDEPTTRLSEESLDEEPPARRRRVAPIDTLPKNKVIGVARSVDVRTDQDNKQKLTFRVDRYDPAGNRLPPVAVQLNYQRGGLVTDGDEVEVVGRWSRGTLIASRIVNLTTGSEVRSWLPRWGKWAVAAVVLLIAGGMAFVLFGDVLTPNAEATVVVPNVVGADEATALTTLRSEGLYPATTEEQSEVVEAGRVIRLEPPPGSSVERNSPVIVVVSSGLVEPSPPPPVTDPPSPPPEETTDPTEEPPTEEPTEVPMVVVPDVEGRLEEEALEMLEAAGLEAALYYDSHDAVAEGYVFGSDPPSGTEVPVGSTITLYVSTGPPGF